MNFEHFKFKIPVHIRWSDMDELGHVNNAIYATFYEEGRSHFLSSECQWNWAIDGIILAKLSMEFKRPLRVDDVCHQYVRVLKIGTKSFELEYLISRKSADDKEEIAAHAQSVLVMYDYKTHSSIEIPTRLRERLKATL